MIDNDQSIDVVDFFHSHGVHGKMKERDNYYIECPSCTKNNLSVQLTTGQWHCWTTGCELHKGGSFEHLTNKLNIEHEKVSFRQGKAKTDKKLTEQDTIALARHQTNKAEIIEWAVSRSLDPNTVFKAGIGYDVEQRAIVYPYYNEKQKLIGYKCKNEHSQWIVGKEPLLYVLDPQDLKKEKVILVEGEVDALTLKGMGLPAVASLGSNKDKGFSLLNNIRRIFIGYDMDDPGQVGSQLAAEKLGPYRCRKLDWQAKDVNDWVKAGATKEDIFDALSKATKYTENDNVLSAQDAVNEYFDQHEAGMRPRRSWGWKKLDALTKGFSGGELIVVQAEANTGKTTWLLNMMNNLAAQKIHCGLASLEEHPLFEITPKLYSCVLGKNIKTYGLSRGDTKLVEDELKHIHLYKDKPDMKTVLSFIRECYYNHDVKLVAVDYFQLLVEDEESVQKIKEAIWALKHLTIELPDLTIVLVVQPKQIDQPAQDERNRDGSKKRKKKLGGWSMRGGAVINQTADKAIMITGVNGHPNITQYEYTKCRGHMDVSKIDWLNRVVQMDYDHDSMRMTEREHLIYEL